MKENNMSIGKVNGSFKGEIIFNSLKEIDEILDQLNREYAKQKPTLVEIEIESGDILGIGLGLEYSLLHYVSVSGNPPYWISKGKEYTEESIIFYCYDEWTEFPSSALISMEDARSILRDFILTGKLSNKIEWAEG